MAEHDDDLGDWSQQEAVAYEVATELLTGMIAWCSSEIAAEESKPVPDREAITRWEERIGRYEAERRGLDPADHVEIGRITTEYGAALRRRYDALRAAAEGDG